MLARFFGKKKKDALDPAELEGFNENVSPPLDIPSPQIHVRLSLKALETNFIALTHRTKYYPEDASGPDFKKYNNDQRNQIILAAKDGASLLQIVEAMGNSNSPAGDPRDLIKEICIDYQHPPYSETPGAAPMKRLREEMELELKDVESHAKKSEAEKLKKHQQERRDFLFQHIKLISIELDFVTAATLESKNFSPEIEAASLLNFLRTFSKDKKTTLLLAYAENMPAEHKLDLFRQINENLPKGKDGEVYRKFIKEFKKDNSFLPRELLPRLPEALQDQHLMYLLTKFKRSKAEIEQQLVQMTEEYASLGGDLTRISFGTMLKFSESRGLFKPAPAPAPKPAIPTADILGLGFQ